MQPCPGALDKADLVSPPPLSSALPAQLWEWLDAAKHSQLFPRPEIVFKGWEDISVEGLLETRPLMPTVRQALATLLL